MKKLLSAYGTTLLLGLAALPVGVAAGAADALFGHGVLFVTGLRLAHPYWFIPFLGLAGLVLAWCLRTFGGKSTKGMTLIFEAGHGVADEIPLRLIPPHVRGQKHQGHDADI